MRRFLIIIDSLTHYYRRLYPREPEVAHGMLTRQLSILDKISKNKIPILLTSQVYSNMERGISPLAGDLLVRFSKTLIKLEKNPRKIINETKNKETLFEIINEGIKLI